MRSLPRSVRYVLYISKNMTFSHVYTSNFSQIHEAPEGTRLGKTTHTRVVLSGKLQCRSRVEGVMCELDSFNSAFQVVVSSGGQAREVRTRSDVIRALLLRKISF